ncbi:acyltransferase family protein [Gemmata sp.]|uniref:acyltransferase family protein n=1 Tax=Gemmata sp. TaxID=1914242 RepID=UPI003F7015C2
MDAVTARPDPTGPRFDIDPFRAVVCLWLVALHLYAGELNAVLSERLGPRGAAGVLNVRLGVESFFVLAGFMLAHTLRPQPGERAALGLYLARRCVRLLPPYWVAVLLAAANLWLARVLVGGGRAAPGAGDVAAQMFLVQEAFGVREAAVGFWSLVALEQFYLLWLLAVAAVRALVSDEAARLRTEAWAAATGCGLLVWLFPYDPAAGFALPMWGGFILLGVLLYRATVQRDGRGPFLLALLAAGAAGYATGDLRFLRAAVAVAALGLIGQGFELPRRRAFEALRWVGTRSYSIYLVHGTVAYRVYSLDPRGEKFGGPLVLVLVALVLSLAAAAVFYRFVERPCLEAARRVRYRRTAAHCEQKLRVPEQRATVPAVPAAAV